MLGKLGYPRERFRLVVNRYEKGGDVTLADIEESLGMKVAVSVPNNFASVAYSINHGVPILKHAPRDLVSRALLELAETLAPHQERKGGWFRALGGKRD
jgi:pilus assembly protein CpaE